MPREWKVSKEKNFLWQLSNPSVKAEQKTLHFWGETVDFEIAPYYYVFFPLCWITYVDEVNLQQKLVQRCEEERGI